MPPHDSPPSQPPTSVDVIVVDGDPLFRRYLAHALQVAGFSARLAADGPGLRVALEQDATDVVVVDLALRHESGLDLCRALRTAPEHADLVIIVTSAATTSAVSTRVAEVSALAAGADRFWPKGRSSEPLVHIINEALARSGRGTTPLVS